MLSNNPERDDDSKKSHHALAENACVRKRLGYSETQSARYF